MRFLVDAQLPPALARWLVAAGHTAEHAADVGLAAASDEEIWTLAWASGAVVVTKDQDFAWMVALRDQGPQVLWVRLGNCSRRALLHAFERLEPEFIRALESGERILEIS